MKDQSKFSKLLNAGIGTVAVAYVFVSVWCYVFFGNATQSVITKNLQPGGLTYAVKIFLSTSLLFSYAIQMFPVTEMIDHLFDKFVWKTVATSDNSHNIKPSQPKRSDYEKVRTPHQQPQQLPQTPLQGNVQRVDVQPTVTAVDIPGGTPLPQPIRERATSYPSHVSLGVWSDEWLQRHFNSRRIVQIFTRFLVVFFTVLLAIIFPDFGLIVSLIGSLSNSGIAFILPMLFYLKLVVWPQHFLTSTGHHRFGHIIQPWLLPLTVLCAGVIASIAGLTVTIQMMLRAS